MEGPGPSSISTSSSYYCALCHQMVTQKRLRRVLSEQGAGKVNIQQMVEFCSTELLDYDVEEAVQHLKPSDRYICKACYEQLNHWEKLKNEMMELKRKIISKIHSLCSTDATLGQPRPPRALPRSLAPKRLRLDTNTSPQVLVSYLVWHHVRVLPNIKLLHIY